MYGVFIQLAGLVSFLVLAASVLVRINRVQVQVFEL